MINNANRIGNFTSSEIVALTSTGKQALGFGVPAITYISIKRMERLLGRSIDDEKSARPLVWGKLLESRVFDLLGLDYTLSSQETDVHPEIEYWAGSKDGTHEITERAVMDIKCPITLKSFCQLVFPLYCGLTGFEAMDAIMNGFEHEGIKYEKHKDGEKYYWQLVSNACINGTDWAELIVYMPYLNELNEIREAAEGNPKNYSIWASQDDELPYLIPGGFFQNLNIIRFKIPNEDKILITEAVKKAGTLLFQNTLTARHDPEVNATIINRA